MFLFIADLKNELHRITAGTLAKHHTIWWFTPLRPDISHGYNPLVHIHNAMDVHMFADCWVKNTGEVDDPTALYLSIPRSEVPIYRPLMACFTMQMFRAWEQRAASNPRGGLPRGIAVIWTSSQTWGISPAMRISSAPPVICASPY